MKWVGRCARHAIVTLFALVALRAQAIDIVTPVYASPPKFYATAAGVQGLCIDVLHAVERVAGNVHFIVRDGVPLTRTERGVREGEYDLLLCATPTTARQTQLRMVDVPIYTVDDVLVVRSDDALQNATLDDVRLLRNDNVILTYAGTGQQAWLSAQPGLTLDVVAPDPNTIFQKLERKRGRFIFAGRAVVANLVRQPEFAGKFRVLPTPVRSMGRYFFFSKRTPRATVDAVERALQKLAASGELQRISSRYVLE